MKQKFFSAFAALVMLVLSFTLSNQAVAQSSENTTAPKQAIKSTDTQYLMSHNAGTTVRKTENGLASIDANGTVTLNTVNENGQSVVTVISKPVANANVIVGQGKDQYIKAYMNWVSANPDYANFVSARELTYIQSDDFETLYKENYYSAQKSALQTK